MGGAHPVAGPNGGTTLLEILTDAARDAPEQVVVHVRGDGGERAVTFAELRDEALRVAGGCLAAGLAPGTCVPLLADRGDDFQAMFWGTLAAGLVPVPLAPEARRVRPVWESLGRPPVVVDEATTPLLAGLPGVRPLRLAELRAGTAPACLPSPAPGDVAFVQFSSGSTGAPRGVELTHASVLANLRQIRAAAALVPEDVVVSWMPYFHDMGLIGTHLAPLAARVKQVRVEPLSFAKRPALWFEAAARHRATLLSAANFALALAVRRIPDEVFARLDLSSVRLLLVGAEPISPEVWRRFVRATGPAGLDPRAPQPVYGLAEATLAVTFPPPGELAVPLSLDRAALSRGRAVDAAPGPDAVELMDVGSAVPGCEVRVVDDAGRPLDDRRVGHVRVRGPQVARGYREDPEATGAVFADGWLRTGDLGFLRGGRLCVTGRHKDVLFVNGRTFHAPDLEAVAAGTPGLPSAVTAVVGSTDPADGAERVVVFVQWARPPGDAAAVLGRVAARVRRALAHDDVRVLPLPAGRFPRTTSGKLRRSLLRDRFAAGAYARIEERWTPPREARPPSPGRPVPPPAQGTPRSRREAEQAVTRVWARVLQLPEDAIGPHDPFLALGGSSLKAMEVLAALEDAFGVTVPPAVLRDCDTVAALAGYVLAHGDRSGPPGPGASAPGAAPAAPAATGAPRPAPAGAEGPAAPVTAGADGSAPAGADGSAAPAATGATSPAATRGSRPGAPAGDATPAGVAVVSMACRFPGADTPEAFWDQLAAGHDAVTETPRDRWTAAPGGAARWGAFLADPAGFDAGYFGIGEEEARAIDPQARIFLELAHEALERAGYAGRRRAGRRVGVFAVTGENGYRELLARAAPDGGLPPAALTGNLPNLVAARVAQSLDLTGPALAVDTACSSALVALHLARRSLQAGECDLAVVGGVNLTLTPTGHQLLEGVGALSPTGRCRAFGAEADGLVTGEGGAAIVLARLEDAHRAGDPVLALVRGTAVNNDGRSLSLLAPNALTQREVVVQAYRDAGVDPDDVSYIEAHGTGTAIGDPVELRSLARAFGPRRDGTPRWIGSVKTNVGHLLNAAGLPGLVKVVLALGHRQLPASLHHTPPAPFPEGAEGHFEVVTAHRAWTAPGPLLAGVNAFGFGGTNAHAVLEQAPAPAVRSPRGADGPHLLTLSARSATALRVAARDLAVHLRAHPELDEGEVCAAVATARDHGRHRLALVARGDLAERLEAGPEGRVARSRPRVVFLFPGQGAPRSGQGRSLYRTAPLFRDVLEEASALVGPVRGRTLAQWCLDTDAPPADLARTEVAQPLLVALGVALAHQLRDWGVAPDAVAGHSVGEIAAACVAGSLTLADAVRFAAERGRLMGGLTAPGAMAAVRGGPDTVAVLLAESAGALCLAADNGPGQVVIAGTPEAVDRAVARLTEDGVPARRLDVSRAFHSPMMEPVAEPLTAAATGLAPGRPSVPLLSTVTARWQPDPDPAHWRRHALRPVRFGAAVTRLLDDGYDTFVELGPGSTLCGPVRAVAAGRAPAGEVAALPLVAGGSGPADAGAALLEGVGRLWTHGVDLDHTARHGGGRAAVTAPTYPFERRRHWPEPTRAPLLHRLVWRDTPGRPGDQPRAVRLVGPDSALARVLADRLTGRGVEVHRDGGTHQEAGTHRDGGAPPAGPDAHTTLLLAGPAVDCDTPEALDAARDAALAAVRDLLPRLGPGCHRLLVVTEDVHVTGAAPERPRPAQALLAGLALALSDETPELEVRGADLSSADPLAARVDALDRELCLRDTPGSTGAVAWRADRRLTRVPAPVTDGPPRPVPLPPDGAYLITGGAGGVGAALARDLAGRGRPTLVLTGRSARPPRGLLDELRTLGAEVEYRSADVSAEAGAETLMTGLPPLDGVFHAAGVVRPGALRAKSPEEMNRVLAAKVRGSHLLARALERHGQRPAVRVAFSSVVSVLPGLAGALGDYAAANAFLDAFAAAERAAGRPWQALNFAAFAQTGLAAEPGLRAAVAARGVTPLPTADALAALRAACGVDAAQLLVADLTTATAPAGPTAPPAPVAPAPVAPPSVAPAPVAPVPAGPTAAPCPAEPPLPALGRADGEPPVPRGATETGPRTPAATVPTRPGIKDLLRRLLADAVHRAPREVADDEPFLGMGLDSLAAVDLVRRLEGELDRPLPVTLFFEYRTIDELAAHLSAGPEADRPSPPAPPAPPAPAGARAGDRDPFPLTPVQRAFHAQGTLHPDVTAYAYVRQTVTGPLDPALLGRALALLAERHPMLRVRIRPGGSGPRQRAEPPAPMTAPPWYEVRDLRGPVEPAEDELCNRPFDLAAEAPVRAVLLRDGADLAHLLLVVHHAAADGFSLNVLGQELWSAYTAFARGRTPWLPPLRAGFADHVGAVEAERATAAFEDDRRYWRDALADRGEPLRLPWDGEPRGAPVPPLAAHQVALRPGLTAALRRCAATHDVSLFHLLLAVHVRCLARWSGRRDIVVNVARASRENRSADADRIVGPFADTLPLLAEVDPREPLAVLAERLRRGWLDAERHARPSSVDLAKLSPATGAGPRTASPAGFSFARFPVSLDADCPVAVSPVAARTASAATRLSLLCWENGEDLHFSWNYPARLFTRDTVERLAREHLAALAEAAEVAGSTDSAEPTGSTESTGPMECTGPTDPTGHSAPAQPVGPTDHTGHSAPAEPTQRTGHFASAPAASGGPAGMATVPRAAATAASPGIVDRLCARFLTDAGRTAVDSGATTMSYAALDRASAALAARLRARGVGPGDLVGLLTEPGADTVVGVVGILRSGAGWVPLDAAHPTARLTDQLRRSTARAVVCHAATRAVAEALDGIVPVAADDPSPVPHNEPAHTPADPDAIAYVIFTSGSTGRPKAVPITHRSMANYLDWALDTFGYRAGDRLAQTASVYFDASVRQLLAPLLVGATVHTLSRELVRDPETLLDRVARDRITVWSSVPTLWERLLAAAENRVRRGGPRPDLSALRWIHVGGEALSPAHVRRWYDLFGPGHRITNLYGPTETTINATCHIIDARPDDGVRGIPIGRPVTGTQVSVVAEDGRCCAPGEPGELLIAGTGLTPGYLGEPGLTAAAFTHRDGRRWYRSGDRVRLSSEGLLEYLGRVDDQVKIRGHRVEPGEIEAVLQTHSEVARAAVVLLRGRLTAFVEPRASGPRPDPAHLRTHLADVLPEYMVPARFRFTDALPLTGTGKVDRRRLAAPAADRSHRAAPAPAPAPSPATASDEAPSTAQGTVRTPPSTPTERGLARIWAELLDVSAVGREDDFFELGGDSILVLEVFERLEKERAQEGRDSVLPRPTIVYAHSTLAGLAAAVDTATARAAVEGVVAPTADGGSAVPAPVDPPVAPAAAPAVSGPTEEDTTEEGTTEEGTTEEDTTEENPGAEHPTESVAAGSRGPGRVADGVSCPGAFPLTPTQRGFLLAEAVEPGSGSAWLARLRLRGPLRTDLLQRAVDVLVARHAMLRTVFPAGARPPVQQELPPTLRLPVVFETLSSAALAEERIAEERRRPLEPWAWPLLRLRVLSTAPEEHILVVHAHHLIGDGYSAALFARELLTVYDRFDRGEPAGLPAPRTTFRDYADLLRRRPTDRDASLPADAWHRGQRAPYRRPDLRRAVSREAARQADGQHGRRAAFRSAGFTLDAELTDGLRHRAAAVRATLYAPVLTAYYRTLAALTGQDDLVVGLAVTGRDRALPGVAGLFGPLAAAVPVRPAPPDAAGARPPGRSFDDDLRRVAAEAVAARTYGPDGELSGGLPATAQFFFTFLDFSALGPLSGETLTLDWEDDAELAPPPVGTDVLVTVRPLEDGLRVTLRAASAAFTPRAFTALTDALREELTRAAAPRPTRSRHPRRPSADAALVGYLPSPRHLAELAGLPANALSRESLRALIFPDGAPRLLEEIDTPLGRSMFVALPLFADELTAGRTLTGHTARAVAHAASLGARCVSLAGMIPALTGYGFEVVRTAGGTTAVTTGHAATAVSVVTTVHAALGAQGRDLADLSVAVVGLGSIGTSSLELLLSRAPRPPARLLLCDLAGSEGRLEELAASLRDRGLADQVATAESGAARALPPAVYEADLIVTAVSGTTAVLDVDRLRPGTVVVDDSFPHCFDTARALARMRRRRDVLIVGGGLLSVGETEQYVAEGLPPAAVAGYAARSRLPGTIASCRLESLLHATVPGLPLVHGLVDGARALAYWEAVQTAGVRAAPLHLLGHAVTPPPPGPR
ncbi:amino acid adenylation domain-containing protein [Streptomyces sp. NPDC050856]|uniref:non-ribosomal peptide synthetase/type I polyketide synthase n=1 Tax=Streptomyces sp. NPDC050856 TaxID=3154939 RepID=UPI0033D231A5